MTSPIQDTILSQLAALPAGKSIDPMNVAKAIQPERWQQILGHVRTNAIPLRAATGDDGSSKVDEATSREASCIHG